MAIIDPGTCYLKEDCRLKHIMNDILFTTMKIMANSPGLYEHLGETPLTILYADNKNNILDFSQYLDTLKIQLRKAEKRQYGIKS